MARAPAAIEPAAVADPARLAALEAVRILDTPPERSFDDVVRLAARLCAAPVALVSLVAEDRQWFKARIGFPLCETDLNASVCAHALSEPDLLVIPDLRADPRTSANPLVTGEPGIRFYAGAPLRTLDGQAVGSLCVIDTVPRPGGLTAEQADDLRALGRQVSDLLEMRRSAAERDALLARQDAELRRERRLDLLAAASEALLSATEPARVLEPILVAGAQSLGFDQSFIYDIAWDRRHLQLTYAVGASDEVRTLLRRAEFDGPLCGIVAETRRPLVLEGVLATSEPRYAVARRTGINAFAGYPITSRGEIVGVISFCATVEPAFDTEALTFFETVARYLSVVRERLDGEAALRESDVRSRRAQEAGRVGTFEVDVDTGLMGISAEFARIYGKPQTGLYSAEAFEALILPEDRDIASDVTSREAGTAVPDVEYRIRRADDGALRWIARRASFARDASGQVVRMFGTVQDITEQRLIRDELARTAEQLRLAADATRIGIFDYDLVTGVLTWDARVRELFGAPAEGPVSYDDTFLPGVHPADRDEADAAVRAAVDPAGPGLFDIEYRVRPLDGGAERWLAARGQAVVRDGRAVRFVGTVRDVTSRRRAEDALRATEERYRLAGRATNDAIWDWDLATNHVLWNEALAAAYGHALETVEPTGDWWIGHIHPEDRARIDASIHAVIDGTGTVWTDEYRFLRADGTYAAVVDRGFVIRGADGKAARMIGAMLDVSRLRAEEQRKTALVELGDRLREAHTSAEAVGVAGEILARTLAAPRAGYARIDPKEGLFVVERDWTAPGIASLQGQFALATFGAALDRLRDGKALVVRDVEAAAWLGADRAGDRAVGARAQIVVPLLDHGELVGLLYAHALEPRDWIPEEAAFAQGVADRTYAALAKLRVEAEQRVLNEELSHRLKNTLAMVLSIATQTLRTVPDRAPVRAFEERIHALASAHDVLLRQSWAAAPAKEVVRAVMAGAGHGDRIEVSGPELDLGPRATLSLSLLLHELATNAAKYGALSVPAGRVAVRWRLEGEGEEREVALDWAERDGPPVTAPADADRKGFGTRLIRMGLIGTGGVELRYPASGFQATMRAPLVQLQRS